MDLAGEDLLAVTTVAAAAARILKDLRERGNHDALTDHHFVALVGTARALLRGDVTETDLKAFEQEPGLWHLLQALVREVKRIGPEKSLAEIRRHIQVNVSKADATAHWREFSRIPNFLKHADRDPKASIPELEVEPAKYIEMAITTYLEFGARVTPEIRVWIAKGSVDKGLPIAAADKIGVQIGEVLASVPAVQRGRAALELVSRLKREQAGS
jgi:hypothetical protein